MDEFEKAKTAKARALRGVARRPVHTPCAEERCQQFLRIYAQIPTYEEKHPVHLQVRVARVCLFFA